MQLIWLNYSGQRQLYGQVAAHTKADQATWLTHPWIVADAQGTCLRLVVISATDQTVTVDPGP